MILALIIRTKGETKWHFNAAYETPKYAFEDQAIAEAGGMLETRIEAFKDLKSMQKVWR